MTFASTSKTRISFDAGKTWWLATEVSFDSNQPDDGALRITNRESVSIMLKIPPTKSNLISSELMCEKDGRWN